MKAPRLIYGDGWYGKERDSLSSFRWMRKRACFFLRDHQASSYIRFIAGHSFSDQKPPLLEIFINGQIKDEKEIEAPFCSYAFL